MFAIRCECCDVAKEGFRKLMALVKCIYLVGACTCGVGASAYQKTPDCPLIQYGHSRDADGRNDSCNKSEELHCSGWDLSRLIMIVRTKVLDWRVLMSEMKEYESERFFAEAGF